MNTKITLFSLISATVISCSSPKEEKAEQQISDDTSRISSTQTVSEYSDDFIDSLRSSPITKTSGDFITADEAWGKLEMYKKYRRNQNSSYNPKKDVYGFTFGVERLRQLIAKIDSLNIKHSDSLAGVRVYFARRKRTGTPPEINDVFLIPVGKNGRNVYPVDDDYNPNKIVAEEPVLILNRSSPCPNQCDTKKK